jgi:hypothetical protein
MSNWNLSLPCLNKWIDRSSVNKRRTYVVFVSVLSNISSLLDNDVIMNCMISIIWKSGSLVMKSPWKYIVDRHRICTCIFWIWSRVVYQLDITIFAYQCHWLQSNEIPCHRCYVSVVRFEMISSNIWLNVVYHRT